MTTALARPGLTTGVPRPRLAFAQHQVGTLGPSVWTDQVTNWYNNYTIEYVPDGGHFLMMEKPDLVIDRIRRMKACALAGAALSALGRRVA